MTRIAGIADLHIGAAHLTTLEDQELALTSVALELVRRRVRLLCIAGDLFHVDRPSPAAITVAGRFFDRLALEGIDVVMSRGNHDPHASEIVSFFRGSVHVPETPHVIHCSGVDVAVLPWLPDRFVRADAAGEMSKGEVAERLTKAARDIVAGFRAHRQMGVPMALVGHFTVAGSDTPTGFNMGWLPGTTWVVPVEDLVDFDVAFVGHIHKRQTPVPNVFVPGSLLPLDFSETEEKGLIVGVFGQGFEFVRIPTPAVGTYDVSGETIASLVNDPPSSLPDLLRIRAHVDEATAREFPPARIERALLEAGVRTVQVELEVVREDRARDAGMTSDLSPRVALERYLETITQADRVAAAADAVLSEVLSDREAVGAGDLRVTRIRAADFLGVDDATLDLEGVELATLVGPVGAGKSSLGADAIRWCLFGASRYGAKASERVVRQGCDMATVLVELRAGGTVFRIVRKAKRDGRGRVATTLDVLENRGAWEGSYGALSSGKVADGEAAIARILGGLSDETLCAANLVVQREADRFVRARAEDRKALLAEAAGLAVYDELAKRTAVHLNAVERELDHLRAKAEPLRARAEAVVRLEAKRADAQLDAAAAAEEVARLTRDHVVATETLERARDRATAYEQTRSDALRVQAELDRIDAALTEAARKAETAVSEWSKKADVARAIVGQKAALLEARRQLEQTREDLAGARASVERIQADLEVAQAQGRRRAEQQAEIARLERDLSGERYLREGKRGDAATALRVERQHREGLVESGCLERCAHVDGCTVRTSLAQVDARIATLERDERTFSEVGPRELEVERQVVQLRGALAPEVDLRVISTELQLAKGVVQEKEAAVAGLERQTQVAEKIAAAEQVLKEHADAVAKIQTDHAEEVRRLEGERDPVRKKRGELNALLLSFGASPSAERDRAEQDVDRVVRDLDTARLNAERAGERVALLDGRLEEMRAAAAELVTLDERITDVAGAAAAWKELVIAWRACRVSVLETSVIPSVEATANEILRRFPYGLQIAFATQREKKSGDGTSETLDVEVLGGLAPVYEGCSGGQRTAIDLALHLAIALVVFRRSTTRLHLVFLDEPEGLDAVGRSAFAAVARWIQQTFDVTVIVASHHEDLVDQLGGVTIRIEGQPGAARVGPIEARIEPEPVEVA